MTYGKLIKIIMLIGVATLLLTFSIIACLAILRTRSRDRMNYKVLSLVATIIIIGLSSGAVGIRMISTYCKSDKKP